MSNETKNNQKNSQQNKNSNSQGQGQARANRSSSGSNAKAGSSNRAAGSGGSGGAASQGKTPRRRQQAKAAKPLRIIPLGGLDGIGKNMTVFEYGETMVVVDAGLMFPDDDQPGVDLILPDYTYILENAHRLKGILITHGHEDHTGALPYLLKDLDMPKLPIYSSKLTLGLVAGKLEEHRIKNPNFIEVKAGDKITVGDLTVDFFHVNHSIPAALGMVIQTPAGTVMHTGDFKLDQTPIDGELTDFAAISRFGAAGVDLLMSDSTNAANAHFTQSEAEVGKALRDIIRAAPKRVIVASFSSHIHRIQQICDAAISEGRKVAVTGRSMLTNTRIARELGYLNVPAESIIDAYAAKDIPGKDIVILCTGSQGEPLSALARMANGEHRTVPIEAGDTVIISASPVPGNEKAVTRVVNALSKIGALVYDKQRAMVHVSGHAGSEELKLVMAMARPRGFLPVHGEAHHLRAHAKLAEDVGIERKNIFVLDNGDSLLLEGGKLRRGEPVESGIVYVDGLSVGDISAVVLKDRQALASDGVVTVVCLVRGKDGRPVGKPEVIMRGVAGGEDGKLLEDLISIVEKTSASFAKDQRLNTGQLKRALRERILGLLWERSRRRPMVIPLILEV